MSTPFPPVDHDTVFKQYLAALLEGDSRVISAIIESLLIAKVSLNKIYSDFIQRGMYEVGVLWERNQIPASIEHLAASATQVVLSELYLKLQCPGEHSPEIIIACVPYEQHDVGSMIVANLCEMAGCKSVLLGANTPTRDMLTYIENRKRMPDLLALSITLPAHRVALEESLIAITAKFPLLNILIGGQALDGHGEAIQFRESLLARYPAVHYMQSLDELERYLTVLVKKNSLLSRA
jgi:MerR family transcriptional regulator, light-induced transcriptional regulator